MEDDRSLLENTDSGDGEEWMDLRSILKVESTSIETTGKHLMNKWIKE